MVERAAMRAFAVYWRLTTSGAAQDAAVPLATRWGLLAAQDRAMWVAIAEAVLDPREGEEDRT